jgi:ubiquinone biosynthesis protein COQ4
VNGPSSDAIVSDTEADPILVPRGAVGRVVAGVRAFRKLIDNPADPLHGPIFQMCAEYRLMRKLARSLQRHGEGRRLLAERPRLAANAVSLAALAALPPRSLGHAYAAYFDDNGISPFDPPRLAVETDEDYMATRLRETHDVFHVVTGYGTDDIGELELQWFNGGNLGWGPLPLLVIVASFFMGRMTKYGGLWPVFKRARAAYRRGCRSRALASVVWEDYWSLPVHEVRALVCAPREGDEGDEAISSLLARSAPPTP